MEWIRLWLDWHGAQARRTFRGGDSRRGGGRTKGTPLIDTFHCSYVKSDANRWWSSGRVQLKRAKSANRTLLNLNGQGVRYWLPFPCDVYFYFQMMWALCLFMSSILNKCKIFHNQLTNFPTLCHPWPRISCENALTKWSIFSTIFRSSSYSFLICRGLTIRELSRFSEKKLKLEKHALDQYADVLERLLNVAVMRLIHI